MERNVVELVDVTVYYRPKRLWLHACMLDRPAVFPTYKKAGGVRYKEEQIRRRS